MATRSLPGFPERQLVIPRGCVLSDAEVRSLLTAADEAKRKGEAWITTAPAPEDGYTVLVPKSAALTRDESIVILSRADEAKAYAYADLLLTFQDGQLVKNWLTLKGTAASSRLTIMGPARRRTEF